MNLDIGPILDGWEYRLGEISARKITGVDGKDKVQLRLDMGILQMECEGRPDGRTPHGRTSLLDHYTTLAGRKEGGPGVGAFALTPEDCIGLQLESVQYYHRRIAFFELKEYEKAKRDAEHNLQILDLVKKHASDPRYALALEQYRPLVLAHRIRAEGSISLRDGHIDEALNCIENGIQEIEDYLRSCEDVAVAEGASEIEFLKRWAEEIKQGRPRSAEERLRSELQRAVQREDFERAAELRDMIQAYEARKRGKGAV